MSFVNPEKMPDDWHPQTPVKVFACGGCGDTFYSDSAYQAHTCHGTQEGTRPNPKAADA